MSQWPHEWGGDLPNGTIRECFGTAPQNQVLLSQIPNTHAVREIVLF